MTSLKPYYSVADKILNSVVATLEEHVPISDMKWIATALQLGDIEAENREPMYIRPAQSLWAQAVHEGKVDELMSQLDKFVISTLLENT